MSRRDRQRRRNRNRGHPFRRVLVLTAVLSLVAIGLGVAGVAGWVVSVAESAPDIGQLKPRDQGQLSEVYASDGSLLGYITSDTLRAYVPGAQLPKLLKEATVAIEDRRFYQHGGIDYEGIVRAAVKDVFGGGKSIQGGSTLTMQLVRNIYLPYQLADTRSIKRKIIEAKLAEELEQKHVEELDPVPVPQRRLLRDARWQDRGRRRRSVAAVLRQARAEASTSRRRPCWPACRRHRRTTTRSSTPVSRSGAATKCCRRWCSRTTSPRPRRTSRTPPGSRSITTTSTA